MKSLFAGLLLLMLVTTVNAESEQPVVGIGVGIHSIDKHPVIDQVIPDMPAFKGGVKAGDRILTIDGKNVDGLSLGEVAKLTRGAAGTRVVLTVQRAGKKDPLRFSLRRKVVTLPSYPQDPASQW